MLEIHLMHSGQLNYDYGAPIDANQYPRHMIECFEDHEIKSRLIPEYFLGALGQEFDNNNQNNIWLREGDYPGETNRPHSALELLFLNRKHFGEFPKYPEAHAFATIKTSNQWFRDNEAAIKKHSQLDAGRIEFDQEFASRVVSRTFSYSVVRNFLLDENLDFSRRQELAHNIEFIALSEILTDLQAVPAEESSDTNRMEFLKILIPKLRILSQQRLEDIRGSIANQELISNLEANIDSEYCATLTADLNDSQWLDDLGLE